MRCIDVRSDHASKLAGVTSAQNNLEVIVIPLAANVSGSGYARSASSTKGIRVSA
jgi:hypothetical protein